MHIPPRPSTSDGRRIFLADADGSRQPTENEIAIAKYQGKHVAEIAGKLCR